LSTDSLFTWRKIMSEETKRYRPSLWRRQISLASFLVIVAVIGVILAVYVVPAYRRYQREESIRVIKATGGRITKMFDRMLFQGEAVDDAAIERLVGRLSWFPELRQVDLSETSVTDTGLMMLIRLPNVQTYYVFKSKVTPEGIQKALEFRPELKIVEAKPDPIATGLAMTPVYRDAIVALAFSPDGQHVLAGNGDGMLHCLDVTGRELRRAIAAHEEWLFDLEFSPRGDRIATAGGDNFIRLWSFPALEPVAEIEAHDDDVHDVAWLDDTQLASAGDDMTVRLWTVEERDGATSLKSSAQPAASHDGAIPRLAQSADGRALLSASRDATIGIWNVRDRFEMSSQLREHQDDVMDIVVSPDAKEAISVSYDGTLCRWNLAQATLTQRSPISRKRLFSVAVDWPGASAIVGSEEGLAKLDLRDGKIVRQMQDQQLIARIAKDSSGDLIATASADGRIVLRDRQLDPVAEIRLYDRHLDPLSDDEFQAASR
jgi:WD40 repeat protein